MVLVARSRERLEKVQKEILEVAKVKAEIIVADFSDTDVLPLVLQQVNKGRKLEDTFSQVKSLNIEIGILVNNVGMSASCPSLPIDGIGPFTMVDEKVVRDMVAVNCTAGTYLRCVHLTSWLRTSF